MCSVHYQSDKVRKRCNLVMGLTTLTITIDWNENDCSLHESKVPGSEIAYHNISKAYVVSRSVKYKFNKPQLLVWLKAYVNLQVHDRSA
jgi:hypothetical protein